MYGKFCTNTASGLYFLIIGSSCIRVLCLPSMLIDIIGPKCVVDDDADDVVAAIVPVVSVGCCSLLGYTIAM